MWQLKQKGHENYKFIDVAVNDDNCLFIDPCLIENWNDVWAIKAMKHINSYFDKLFHAYKTRNREDMRYLLSHAGEQNANRLGYGKGDMNAGEWKKIEKPVYYVNGKELLLVPKQIVRKKYLFGVNRYFTRIILERMINEGHYQDAKGKTIPKKEIVKSKRYSGEHWQYDEAIKYTIRNNDALEEYHRKLRGFYLERGKSMTDEELDFVVYGHEITQGKG